MDPPVIPRQTAEEKRHSTSGSQSRSSGTLTSYSYSSNEDEYSSEGSVSEEESTTGESSETEQTEVRNTGKSHVADFSGQGLTVVPAIIFQSEWLRKTEICLLNIHQSLLHFLDLHQLGKSNNFAT